MVMKKKRDGYKDNTFDALQTLGVEIYLFVMLAVYPLFMGKGYGELVYRKWALFLYASMAFVIVSTVCFAVILAGKRKKAGAQDEPWKFWSGWIITDWFVFAYMLCVIVSFAGAVDRKTALWGIETWYVGAVTQLLFVGIYFGISRGYTELKYMEYLAAAVAVIVDGIIILQRFGVNVANLYDGYSEEVKGLFVTTMGQVTWTSSYTNIILAAGMGIYYLAKEKREKIFLGICIGFGFGAGMLINCDSGMIAVAAALMVMLWLAIGSKERLLALTEMVMAMLAATAAVGIFERVFASRVFPIDAVYLKAAQSGVIYVLLAAAAVFYWLVKKGRIPWDAKERTVKALKGIYILCVCLGIIGMVVLFVLHWEGYFTGSPTETYFRFDNEWGKGRGFIWRVAASVYGDYNAWRKLFGCGPDNLMVYAYDLMGEEMRNFWPELTITNAHNEWLNTVVNYGMVGGIAYLGIFVSAAYRLLKSAIEDNSAAMSGMGLAVVGYMAHNLLCYQQIIGTSLVFMLMSIGVAKARAKDRVQEI